MPHQGGKTDMNALLRKAGIDADTVEAVFELSLILRSMFSSSE